MFELLVCFALTKYYAVINDTGSLYMNRCNQFYHLTACRAEKAAAPLPLKGQIQI